LRDGAGPPRPRWRRTWTTPARRGGSWSGDGCRRKGRWVAAWKGRNRGERIDGGCRWPWRWWAVVGGGEKDVDSKMCVFLEEWVLGFWKVELK